MSGGPGSPGMIFLTSPHPRATLRFVDSLPPVKRLFLIFAPWVLINLRELLIADNTPGFSFGATYS